MYTDSHCHLNFPELQTNLGQIRQDMADAQVTRALLISTKLETFPDVHALAMAQQSGSGGAVLSFVVKAADPEQARARAFHVMDSMQTLSLSTNLGDVKTLVAHPASTSHGRLSEAQRQSAGIGQGLVRVAVGLEHMTDIQADLARGLDSL